MKQDKIVISLCDLSGVICVPWAQVGFTCYAVDIQHSIRKDKVEEFEGGGRLIKVWGDIRSWFPPENQGIEILFSQIPCTDLSISGARDFAKKGGYRLSDALELFDTSELIGRYLGVPYMIENPVSRLSSWKRPPNFTFHPYQFSGYLDPEEREKENYTKKTCLWTGGGFVMPEPKFEREPEVVLSKNGTKKSFIHFMTPGPERANLRAMTPMGFAKAVFLANHNVGPAT